MTKSSNYYDFLRGGRATLNKMSYFTFKTFSTFCPSLDLQFSKIALKLWKLTWTGRNICSFKKYISLLPNEQIDPPEMKFLAWNEQLTFRGESHNYFRTHCIVMTQRTWPPPLLPPAPCYLLHFQIFDKIDSF